MAKKIKISKFDAAEYLNSEETIQEFLNLALNSGDQTLFIQALNTVARAKGMTELAANAGVSRESLYKTLSEGSKPYFSPINKLVNALGMSLSLTKNH